MPKQPDRIFKVAIIGGGFAGVYCARELLRLTQEVAQMTVGIIASENHMVFQPMLPEVAGGSLSPQHVVNPIRMICRGAEVLKGEVTHIDLENRIITLNGGMFTPHVTVGFEHLMLAPGAGVDLSRTPGMGEHAYLMRTVGDAMKLRAAIISRLEEANLITNPKLRKELLSFVIVGGGYSGVETAGQIQDLILGARRFYENIEPDEPSVTLIHSGDRLLGMLSDSLGTYTGKCLAESRQVITIGFDEPVMRLFPLSEHAPRWRGNKLVVDFADPGSIHAHFLAKEPGPRMHLDSAQMTFRYKDSFQAANNLEAYEYLILEAMLGNQAFFTRSDGIERQWEIAAPVLAFRSASIWLRAVRPDRIAGTMLATAACWRHTPVVEPQGGSWRYPVATVSIASKLLARTSAVCGLTDVPAMTPSVESVEQPASASAQAEARMTDFMI